MTDSNPKARVKLQIDENLKRIYDETLKEDIPDHLTQLLAQLREKTGAVAKKNNAEDT